MLARGPKELAAVILLLGLLLVPWGTTCAQWGPHGGPLEVLPGVDFGQVQVGDTATQTYVFVNRTGEQATINAVGFGDPFYSQYPYPPAPAVFKVAGLILPRTLPPGGRFTFTIQFSPQAARTYRLDVPPEMLTMCVTTAVTQKHIHYLIPLSGTGVSSPSPPPPGRVYALMHVPSLRAIEVIDVGSASLTNEIQLPIVTTGPLPIAVSPDGRYGMVHLASLRYVWVFEIPSGREVARLPDAVVRTTPLAAPQEMPGSMLFTPDGRYALAQLVSGGYEPVLQIYDLQAGTIRTAPMYIATTGPIPIVVTRDGKYALFCGYCTRCNETELKVMDLSTGGFASSALLGIKLQVSLPIVVTSDSHYALVHVANRGVVVILDIATNQTHEVPLTNAAGSPVILPNPLPIVLAEQR